MYSSIRTRENGPRSTASRGGQECPPHQKSARRSSPARRGFGLVQLEHVHVRIGKRSHLVFGDPALHDRVFREQRLVKPSPGGERFRAADGGRGGIEVAVVAGAGD